MANSIENVYAQALFELCCENKCVETVFEELGEVSSIIFAPENKEFVELLSSPLIDCDDKYSALKNVFEGKINQLTFDFIRLISDKERIRYLPGIYDNFKQKYYNYAGIVEVTAVTSQPLSDKLKNKLINKLELVSEKKIILTETIDKSILGGIVLKYGNTEIDSSVRSKLDKLKKQIDGVIA